MDRITLELSIHLITIAEYRANQMGLPVNTAIVDECGALIAFHRMDNARLAGIDIAENKAWTSATMQMPTVDLARLALPGGDAYGVNTANQGKVVILGGGIPLNTGTQIVGGIGVSQIQCHFCFKQENVMYFHCITSIRCKIFHIEDS